MVKLTFILLGFFIIIHFTLYYWNIDPFDLYSSKKNKIEEIIKQEKKEENTEEDQELHGAYDFGNLKDNLEDCLNELKQYNSININNE